MTKIILAELALFVSYAKMKVRFIFMLLLAASALVSCNDDNETIEIESLIFPNGKNYSTQCGVDGLVVISNANQADTLLGEYIADFKREHLLVCGEIATYGIDYVETRMEVLGEKYILNIDVHTNLCCVMEPWCVGYVVPKNFNVNSVEYIVSYPDIENHKGIE